MAAEMHHLLYHHNHGLRTSILRLTNTYGPKMNVGKGGQSFLGAWLDRLSGGEEVLVFGDGCQMRDIAFIDDVVDAFLSVASEPAVAGGQVFNVGGKETCSLKQIAGVLLELWPTRAAMRHAPFPEGQELIEIGNYRADLQKMTTHFGWRPQVGLREGLRRTVDWMQSVGLVRARKGAHES
jgi:nucleoside-diphosphate-sugar epimerase